MNNNIGFKHEQNGPTRFGKSSSSGNEEECVCTVARVISASVNYDPASPSNYSTFLSVIMVIECRPVGETHNNASLSPASAKGDPIFYHSYRSKQYPKPCQCPIINQHGYEISVGGAMVGSLTRIDNRTTRGSGHTTQVEFRNGIMVPTSMGEWAKEIVTQPNANVLTPQGVTYPLEQAIGKEFTNNVKFVSEYDVDGLPTLKGILDCKDCCK